MKGKLDTWPQRAIDDKPSPAGHRSIVTIAQYNKTDPLVASGILGPVTIRAAR